MADPGCSKPSDNDESDESSERGGTGGAGTDKVSVGVSVSPGFGATPKGTASVDVTSTIGEVEVGTNYKIADNSGKVVYTESDSPVSVSETTSFKKVFDFAGSGLADLPPGDYTLTVEATENGVVVGTSVISFTMEKGFLLAPAGEEALNKFKKIGNDLTKGLRDLFNNPQAIIVLSILGGGLAIVIVSNIVRSAVAARHVAKAVSKPIDPRVKLLKKDVRDMLRKSEKRNKYKV